MPTGLLVIDIQNDYFPGGAFPLVGPDEAAERAAEVLSRFRAKDLPVIHVQHIWDAPDAEFFKPDTHGVQIHSLVAPDGEEPVIRKAYPNTFRGTRLSDVLESLSVDHLVVAGMMTSMCVDATVRAAADLGHTVTVVADACAAPDLEFDGRAVAAADVQAAFLAALADSYAVVTTSRDLDM